MDLSRMFNRLGGLRPGARLCYVAPNNPILTDPILGLDLRIARAVWSF